MGAEAILFVPLFFGVAVVHSGSPELNRQLYTDIKTWPKPARALNLKCVLYLYCRVERE